MNKKEYKMPDGSTVGFWYDEDNLGKISLEAMDMLMSMVAEKWIPCSGCERRCKKWEHSETSQE